MTKLILSIQINNDDTDINLSLQQGGVPDFREWTLAQYFRQLLLDEIGRMKLQDSLPEGAK